MNKAVFIDKDGTLIENVPYNADPDKIILTKGASEALKLLKQYNFKLIIISNQPGVALGYFKEKELNAVNKKIQLLLKDAKVQLDDFYYCPHLPEGNIFPYNNHCNCRKPLPGLILKAAEEHQVDLQNSWMIGDILNDVEAGNAAGCKSILIDNGNETEWILNEKRIPDFIVKEFSDAASAILSIKTLM